MKIKKIVQGHLRNNTFIISYKETNLLIDPGLDYPKIEKFVEENNHIDAILITHGHFDHVASAAKLQKKYNVSIYFGKDDHFYLLDPFGPLKSLNGSLFGKLDLNFKYIPIQNKIYNIKDIQFEAIKTPGHTPGSTCYYFKDLNCVFTGDTLFFETIGRTDFEKGDFDTIKNSIQSKLYTLPTKTKVWPGHGKSTTIEYEMQNNSTVKGV